MIRAVLFDRDGTLIVDGAHPLELMPGAASAVSQLRSYGMRLGVVTNQPRAGTNEDAYRRMQSLHRCIEAQIGALDGWFVCTHASDGGCNCRKPMPALILNALEVFGVAPHECVMIGDIGSDIEAARAAGVHAILVPTPVTRPEEIEAAPLVCANLREAMQAILRRAAA